ncbi:hypothetical protein CHY08_07160 [Rhizobium leguminosarum bv. viciae]|uniref:hypothetical protein n=1 Tax=Rhizobium leguminosarum TaxID=384 RepID=UPI000B8C8529|nr:hypothetical protein [Rhizobium leguminosarum]ASR06915.1 hypothetical protein CHY08_07160 [Rhizobium leguminosarum bv. viciae]
MPKNSFLEWDTNANLNTDVGGININEGCPPSNINNSEREIMAQLKAGVDGKTVYAAKSSGYTAVAADNNGFHRCTASLTVALTAAATLAAGWHLLIFADGGDVTIDPNASETINGAATTIVPNGNMAIVICDGSNFSAAGIPSLWSLISNDAGAAIGPLLSLFRNSASPAAADVIGGISFDGRDSAGNKQTYGMIEGSITDPTTTSEDGALLLRAVVAGALTTIININGAAVTVNGTLTVTG